MAGQTALFVEVWLEYALAMSVLALRAYARLSVFGKQVLDAGDAFSFLAVIFYTIMVTFIYKLSELGTNIGLDTKTAMALTEAQVVSYTRGSKYAVTNWYMYICLLWCLKGILVAVFWRMSKGLDRQAQIVRYLAIFCFITWLGSVLCHTFVCHPFDHGWQVQPYAGDDCTVREPNYIWIALFNALSDLAIIAVPMPLLFKAKIPWGQRLALVCLFSLGIFCIIATSLRAHYSLHSLETLPIALGWASRENLVATIAVCAPGIKPFISRQKWFGSSRGSQLPFTERDVVPASNMNLTQNSRGQIVVKRSVDVHVSKPRGTSSRHNERSGLGDAWNMISDTRPPSSGTRRQDTTSSDSQASDHPMIYELKGRREQDGTAQV